MKQNRVFIISLALFSLLTGYLLSAISFTGKAGITLFYTQYQFIKTWWKGALLVFIVWIVLFTVLHAISRRVSKPASNIIFTVSLLIAIAGMLSSYIDFRNSLSHRWLGERFHLGVYVFWFGWIAIALFLLLKKKTLFEDFAPKTELNSSDPI